MNSSLFANGTFAVVKLGSEMIQRFASSTDNHGSSISFKANFTGNHRAKRNARFGNQKLGEYKDAMVADLVPRRKLPRNF